MGTEIAIDIDSFLGLNKAIAAVYWGDTLEITPTPIDASFIALMVYAKIHQKHTGIEPGKDTAKHLSRLLVFIDEYLTPLEVVGYVKLIGLIVESFSIFKDEEWFQEFAKKYREILRNSCRGMQIL